MSPGDLSIEICDGLANSIDPDQTTPLEDVWLKSTLFVGACLSKYL